MFFALPLLFAAGHLPAGHATASTVSSAAAHKKTDIAYCAGWDNWDPDNGSIELVFYESTTLSCSSTGYFGSCVIDSSVSYGNEPNLTYSPNGASKGTLTVTDQYSNSIVFTKLGTSQLSYVINGGAVQYCPW